MLHLLCYNVRMTKSIPVDELLEYLKGQGERFENNAISDFSLGVLAALENLVEWVEGYREKEK